MHTQDVLNICATLMKVGKKPSIGLVRAKLSGKVPLAIIVKGIQQFHANPQLGIAMEGETSTLDSHKKLITGGNKETLTETCDTEMPPSCASCGHRLNTLEDKLEAIQKEVIGLQAQVRALTGS